jgi:DNA-binding NarL/FixJ family response regulator
MNRLRYLIVDDSPTVRLTIHQALTQEQVPTDQIAEAATASDAIASFDRAHPHVVFLDVSLSDGSPTRPARPAEGQFLIPLGAPRPDARNGNDLARYMIARDPKVTVVVCTGTPADDPRVLELVKAGAFQVLQKPVRLAQIREVLRQIKDERTAAASPGGPGA